MEEKGEERPNALANPSPSPRSPLPPSKRVVSSLTRNPAYEKKTRDLPNLSNCHRCGARRASKGARDHLELLPSQWRIALLCSTCHGAIASAEACSYCFAMHAEGGQSLDCQKCRRRVHRSCIPEHHRYIPPSGFDRDSFACVDCAPYIKPRILSPSLDDAARDARSVAEEKAAAAARAKENWARKAAAATQACLRAKSALDAVLAANANAAAPSENPAVESQQAMNGTKRVTRGTHSNSNNQGRRIGFKETQSSESYKLCGNVGICTKHLSFSEDAERRGFLQGSSCQLPPMEDREMFSDGDNGSRAISDASVYMSNSDVPFTECSNGIRQHFRGLRKSEGLHACNRYSQKYSKGNWRWKKGIVGAENCMIIPWLEMARSEKSCTDASNHASDSSGFQS